MVFNLSGYFILTEMTKNFSLIKTNSRPMMLTKVHTGLHTESSLCQITVGAGARAVICTIMKGGDTTQVHFTT